MMDITSANLLKMGGIIVGAIVAGLELISPAKTAYEWMTKPANKVQPKLAVKATFVAGNRNTHADAREPPFTTLLSTDPWDAEEYDKKKRDSNNKCVTMR